MIGWACYKKRILFRNMPDVNDRAYECIVLSANGWGVVVEVSLMTFSGKFRDVRVLCKSKPVEN